MKPTKTTRNQAPKKESKKVGKAKPYKSLWESKALISVGKSEKVSVNISTESIMPSVKNLGLSAQDLADITAYLTTLRK